MMNSDSSVENLPENVKQSILSGSVTHVLRFAKPAEYLTMNQRKHWAWVSKQKRAWRDAASWAAQEWRPVPSARTVSPPALVRFGFPVSTNRRRDPHNFYPTIKPIIDGFTDAGLWPDDTPEFVMTVEPWFDHTTPLVTVVIQERWLQ